MPDKEKVIEGLKYCTITDGIVCPKCPYRHEDDCIEMLTADALELLKEQEEQKRKWLQAIADNQLAVSPIGYETEEGLARKTGEWNGLQMAWDILMEGR
jgi:hypothetical protein